MNLWKKISLGIFVLTLILSGIVVFLVNTDRGLYFLFNISSHWIPGLEINQISGNWHNLYLKNIIYTPQSGLRIEASELHLILDTHCLRKGKLYINDLLLKNIDIVVDLEKFSKLSLSKENKKVNYLINLLKPYPMIFNHVTLNNANIRINNTIISVKNFTSGLQWQKKNLVLNSTLLQGLLINLPKIEKIPRGDIIEYALQQFWLKEKSLDKVLRIFLSKLMLSKTTNIHLPLNFEIKEFKGEHLRLVHPSINVDFVIHSILMKLSSVNSDICLSKMNIDSNQGTLSIIANMRLFGSWPVNIILDSFLNIKSLQSEKISLKIKGILTKKIETSLHFSGPFLNMDLCETICFFKTKEISSLNLVDTMISNLDRNGKNLFPTYRTVNIPKFMIDLTIKSFYWRKLSVDKIYINGYVKLIDQPYGKLNARIENIVRPSLIDIRLATLEITGNEKKHNLQLLIHGKPISGKLYLIGSFDRGEQSWRGQLSNVLFKTSIEVWNIIRSFPIDHTEKKINTESRCKNNSKMEFCIPRTINVGSEGRSVINIKCSDLEILKPLIPDTMCISGMLVGKINVTWNNKKGDILQGDMFLSGRKIKISQIMHRHSFPTTIDLMNLKVSINDDHVRFSWTTYLTNIKNDHSQFFGEIQVSNLYKHHNFYGKINISDFKLTSMNDFYLSKWRVRGMLNANLRFFGDIEHPQIFGNVNIRNINVSNIPVNIQSSEVIMHFNGMHSIFQTKVRTQRGSINLNGYVDWKKIRNWHIHVSVRGNRIHITAPTTINFDILSNVVFEVTPISFTFKGYVNIPWARIVVNTLPEKNEAVSNDEILLDENMKPIELKSTGIPINGNITVHIGDNVKIDAFGINANLIGDIKVIQSKHGLNLNGQVNMSKGRFYSYGQDFIIRKGELFFYSTSSVQPFINIEAIRNPDTTEKNIIVGIRITGMTDELKTEIFSDPVMSQQDILSYLLRGQGMNSGQDHTVLTSMIMSLWTTQSSQLVNKIGEAFGIRNFILDTKDIENSSQLVASGYLLPDLQVKYGVDIFNTLGTLTLHYHLIPELYLEVMSGIHQSIDLVYRFKF